MATFTTYVNLRKPDGTDFVSRANDLNGNWDLLDALFNASTGHKHTGAGTNGPRLLLVQDVEVDDDTGEAAVLTTLDANTRLIANLNRIRYWITQVSGEALGTVTQSLATHRGTFHGVTAFATPTVALGAVAAAGAATTVIRSDATILAFDATTPAAVGTAGAVGAATVAARRDHAHAHGSLAAIANAHAAADITNAAAKNAVTAFTQQYYATRVDVAYSATPTFNWNSSNVQSMTLTGNITSLTLSNPGDGGRYILILIQDATGGRTVAWPASVKWPGGTAPTLSGANKIDVISLIWNGTSYFGSVGLNY